jgi:hypothetical protein
MPEKLNLDEQNVDVFELTTTQARSIDVESELEIGEQLQLALDEAQAKAFSDEHDVSYLVLKIMKG